MSVRLSIGGRSFGLGELPVPLELGELIPGRNDWEVEIGFGKGRYLLRRACEKPEAGFVGVEVASAYYRLASKRAQRRHLENIVLIRGEALYLLSASLPVEFASAVHVYFPDPWPKARHQKRRLFDAETVDLVLGLLNPGGYLYFATDHLDYGAVVYDILKEHPAVDVKVIEEIWPDGARTNYEAKYIKEGRPILRLEILRRAEVAADLLHPQGYSGVTSACCNGTGP